MTTRHLLREQRGNIITPRPGKGLFLGLRLAKAAAKRLGYPPQLINKVTR